MVLVGQMRGTVFLSKLRYGYFFKIQLSVAALSQVSV